MAVEGLRKVHKGGRVAVCGMWLGIRERECFGLLGPNGAGKSTLINCLTGVYEATEGTAVVACLACRGA